MNRSAGTGLMAFSIVLVIVGAILDYAVTATASGFNINTIGMILLIVGIVAFVVSLVVIFAGRSHRTTISEDVRMTPDGGRQRYVDSRDDLAS
jgi:beta-lactamase regulating signal transducer with metallopeptidase domain